MNEATDLLESYALKRATVGVERPDLPGRQEVGTVNEISDTLLIFMLKARRPKSTATGSGGSLRPERRADPRLDAQSRDAVKTLMANPKAYKAALEPSPRLPPAPMPQQTAQLPSAAGGSA